jgi:two-component system nitrogen regulation response regulator GlnG
VAASDVPVLVTGESGTGKELVARAIHRHGRRHERNFLAICLAALSPGVIESELFGHVKGAFTGATQDRTGLLELASGGTVLLDEIGDAPGALQVKLLRALEQREITPVGGAQPRPVDVRIVAATNRALPEMIRAGEFREDLFFRLSVFHIHLPPLRERPEDVPDLARAFLARCRPHAEEARLSDEVLDELESRAWPGNVRELRNVVEHAAVLARGSAIRLEHLPAPGVPVERPRWADEPDAEKALAERIADWARRAARSGSTEGPALHERFLELVEAPLLRTVLAHCGGNRAAASQVLGIHRATLRQKLRRYGME